MGFKHFRYTTNLCVTVSDTSLWIWHAGTLLSQIIFFFTPFGFEFIYIYIGLFPFFKIINISCDQDQFATFQHGLKLITIFSKFKSDLRIKSYEQSMIKSSFIIFFTTFSYFSMIKSVLRTEESTK